MYPYDLNHKGGETYRFDQFEWDVTEAKRILLNAPDRPVQEVDVEKYWKIKGDLDHTDRMKVGSLTIDLTVPLIYATSVYRNKNGQIVTKVVSIDGAHRLESAHRGNIATHGDVMKKWAHEKLPYYLLTAVETDAIAISPSLLAEQMRLPVVHQRCNEAKLLLCMRLTSQTSWLTDEHGHYLPLPVCPVCHEEITMSTLIEGKRTVGMSKKPLSERR